MLVIILSGLVGGILWNLVTWLFGLPSSSSHALFGGLIGATIAALGLGGVKWDGVITSIVLPALFAPVVAGLVAGVGTWLVFKIVTGVPERRRDDGFRWGQVGSASLVSLAHGTNDAQKTMGVITLALVAYGGWSNLNAIPLWVKIACALAIAAGTWVGGWRVIRTLGKGLVEIASPQGMAAETSSAVIISRRVTSAWPCRQRRSQAAPFLDPGSAVGFRSGGACSAAWLSLGSSRCQAQGSSARCAGSWPMASAAPSVSLWYPPSWWPVPRSCSCGPAALPSPRRTSMPSGKAGWHRHPHRSGPRS